jgi:hypothetical protein
MSDLEKNDQKQGPLFNPALKVLKWLPPRAAQGRHFSRQNASIPLQMKALRALFSCLRRDMVPDAVIHD